MTSFRIAGALVLAASMQAAVRLPSVLSDHMILQQGVPVRIWGWAGKAEVVTVGFRDQKVTAQTGPDGKWSAFLRPLAAGGPDVLSVSGENRIEVRDVLVGEVWVGSGQSNMQMLVAGVNNAEAEIAAARFPGIREFQMKMTAIDGEADDVEGQWQVASPETVRKFSATGYFFARELHARSKLAVGILSCAWGGKPVQSFIRRRALEADPATWPVLESWARTVGRYAQDRDTDEIKRAKWIESGSVPAERPRAPMGFVNSSRMPSSIYNGMIAPLTPYAVRGVIWYQGESNSTGPEAYLYRRLFRLMIEDWRASWRQPDLPFLFVQLPNYRMDSWWTLVRESQADALSLRNTAMAITVDIGESMNIHPKNKQEVGRRLALLARNLVYGESLTASGPLYRQMSLEGAAVRLWFDWAGKGLAARGGGPVTGFSVAGEQGSFVPAQARIEGATVVVSSPQVARPTAVRYAWEDDPVCNLVNSEGLPAAPFRTDRSVTP